jgi:serine/threonine protein kinase
MDLKLENIGWSLSRGKLVFLDFNLSVIIGEKIGYKTLFGFVGTYNYSSPEMRKLFFLKSQSYVDLYYNDFHCLQKIWEKL